VVSAAAEREQAAIVFQEASNMAQKNPQLKKRAEFYKRSIYEPSTLSSYKVLSAEALSKHGYNASAVIFDEFHAQRNRDLYDVLHTSQGSREQPVEILITTAGTDKKTICGEMHDYAQKVISGILKDEHFYGVIFKAEEDDDWTDKKIWKKANPNLGVTVGEEYIATECKRAQEVPAYENTFRRLHLNQWTKQESRWMPMAAWRKCGNDGCREGIFEGHACYSGLDLSNTLDITALVHVFPFNDKFFIIPRFWIPEETMVIRAKRDKVPYELWVKQGFISATPGNVVDYSYILEQIDKDAQLFDIKKLAFDRWGASRIIQQLQEREMNVVEFGQGFVSMNRPTKELLALVMAQRIQHGGNPVLDWMADNVVVETDAAGNFKPSKKKSGEKIDGIVALIMGLDIALISEGTDIHSVYEERGFLVL